MQDIIIQRYIKNGLLGGILFFLSYTVGASDGKGLLPVNRDGFETGD